MGKRLGIIAGSGEFPLLALEEARKGGYTCFVAAIKGEADPVLEKRADALEWLEAGSLTRLLDFLARNSIQEVLLAGKVRLLPALDGLTRDPGALGLWAAARDKGPAGLIGALIGVLESRGLEVLDPTFLLEPYFCSPGLLAGAPPSAETLADVDLGFERARVVADLDIGQTIVVKNGLVVSVEGTEGTDRAIERGGELAGPGVVVVKVGRTGQDPRIDLPAVGLGTVRSLLRAGGRALCFEARTVLFFQREEAIRAAAAGDIVILAR